MSNPKKHLWAHIGLVTSASFLLLMATVAWFLNSWQANTTPMTFAAQSTGAGASLYEVSTCTDRELTFDTLAHTVSFQTTPTVLEDKVFTLHTLVPGQAEYYLLKLTGGTGVALQDFTLTDDQGNPVTQVTEGMLANCLSFHFLPLDETQLKTALAGTPVSYSVPLVRTQADGPLDSAPFAQITLPTPGDTLTGALEASAYVLVLFYDPWYQQPTHTQTLSGTLSFTLAVATAPEP